MGAANLFANNNEMLHNFDPHFYNLHFECHLKGLWEGIGISVH